MRILVTGANGFVGRHVVRELVGHKHEVIAFDLPSAGHVPSPVISVSGNICNLKTVNRLVTDHHPDACIHLSALAFVPQGWTNPQKMFSVNLNGTINILEAFRKSAPESRFLLASSAEIYGRHPRNHLITEEELIRPDNPYAVSKAAADFITLLYSSQHGMHTMSARPCNHIGPGQSSLFAVPSFAVQLVAIMHQKAPPVIKVGNLESKRNFTDVRDVARAYRLIAEKGRPGQAYNIASLNEITIRSILDKLCAITGVHPEIEIDPTLFRPLESPPLLDTSRIKADVRWKPEIKLEESLRDVVNDIIQSSSRRH